MDNAEQQLRNAVQRAAEKASSEFDVAAAVDALGAHRGRLLSDVRQTLRTRLEELEPREAWSVRTVPDGVILHLGDPGYGGAFLALARRTKWRGRDVDSGVTPLVVTVIETSLVDFYQSPAVQARLSGELERQLRQHGVLTSAVQGEMARQVSFAAREIRAAVVEQPVQCVTLDRLTDALGAFFASAAGHQVLALVANVMATGAGKIVLAKVSMAVASAASSGALKAAVVTVVKKVGITTLMKTTIGKAALALVFGGAALPVELVTATVVAVMIPYQWKKLPQKLASTLPDQVAPALEGDWSKIHAAILPLIFRQLAVNALQEIAGGLLHGAADGGEGLRTSFTKPAAFRYIDHSGRAV